MQAGSGYCQYRVDRLKHTQAAGDGLAPSAMTADFGTIPGGLASTEATLKGSRISHRYSQGQRIAYPSQNSIAALPEEEQSKCLQGVFKAVLQAYDGVPMGKPKKLDEWNVRNLGERLADILMRLHNFKSGLLLPPRYDCFSIV
ncbi:hypothetical protein NQ176_g4363 [Zarea fungicola]|uniref:Uncharacterized protein n=1 Tax=Zarea fungicola TaxID=93591 RepID=A0ACC1NEJ0_9HYPO|nr:hypothetical protein NQ176_g4363 [Lecanicillium fungicola]